MRRQQQREQRQRRAAHGEPVRCDDLRERRARGAVGERPEDSRHDRARVKQIEPLRQARRRVAHPPPGAHLNEPPFAAGYGDAHPRASARSRTCAHGPVSATTPSSSRTARSASPSANAIWCVVRNTAVPARLRSRSEEHTSELQSPDHLVCRLLLEKKKNNKTHDTHTTINTNT